VSDDKEAQAERARRIHDQIESLKRNPARRPAVDNADRSDAPRSPRDFIADRMKELDDKGSV
jgi:hypothetical protein